MLRALPAVLRTSAPLAMLAANRFPPTGPPPANRSARDGIPVDDVTDAAAVEPRGKRPVVPPATVGDGRRRGGESYAAVVAVWDDARSPASLTVVLHGPLSLSQAALRGTLPPLAVGVGGRLSRCVNVSTGAPSWGLGYEPARYTARPSATSASAVEAWPDTGGDTPADPPASALACPEEEWRPFASPGS